MQCVCTCIRYFVAVVLFAAVATQAYSCTAFFHSPEMLWKEGIKEGKEDRGEGNSLPLLPIILQALGTHINGGTSTVHSVSLTVP